MLLFIILFATGSCTQFARTILLLSLNAYFYEAGDLLSGFLFCSGALLADLSFSVRETRKRWPVALTVLSLFLASYPDEPERAAWSRVSKSLFDRYITISGGKPLVISLTIGETHRTIAAIASILLITSIIFNPSLQRLLSHRFLVFLGSISFPLYLLHGTFMRTALTWSYDSVYAGWQTVLVFVLWGCLLLGACYGWRRTVDEFALHVSRLAEEVMTGKVALNLRYYSHLYHFYRRDKDLGV
jgi:hypothetical protein